MAAMMAAPLMISRLDDRPIVESVRICILASGVASGAKLPVGHDEIYFHPDSVSFTRDQPRQGPNPSFMRYGHGSVVAM